MQQEHVDAGKAIQRRTGKTFHLATRLLPERIRRPTYVCYGFFRIADEVVDDADDDPPAAQADRLDALREQALGEEPADAPVLEAFQDVRDRYGIPDEDVDAFLEAMKADIHVDRYDTYAELESYMAGSAAAVGAMMTAIMEPDDEEIALPHARTLGEAFQLTNFLRDVREDLLDRGRIYVPRETLHRHGATEAQIEDLEFSKSFAEALADELQRAEGLYREGVAGIRYLPEDCQLPVLAAAILYAEHHRVIRARGYDVLTAEPSLSTARKLWVLARTRWHWYWNRDPEAVFRRVSAVPTSGLQHRGVEPGGHLPTR